MNNQLLYVMLILVVLWLLIGELSGKTDFISSITNTLTARVEPKTSGGSGGGGGGSW